MKKNFFTGNLRSILYFWSLTLALNIFAQDNLSALLPYPNHIEQREGTFSISANEQIVTDSDELIFAATELQHICN